ncbi:MAG: hypothetical protein L0K82_08065 [Pisciglobus halotolerans]|nr:hypothetical protein [Pisciglobus halotolerans]
MKKTKLRRRLKRVLLFLVLLALLVIPIVSVLAENLSGDTVIVESSETLEKTSFLSGKNIRVDGDINGTTFITGGENIEVNGTIDGDLFVVGQSLTINGMVKGSVFLTGQNIALNSEVENNMYAVGQGLKIQSQTSGNIFMVGQNVSIDENAVIERDAFIGATTIYHNGVVNGDFKSSSDSLVVGGKITGDLTYSSKKQADFLNTSDIVGRTSWKKIETTSTKDRKRFFSIALFFRILWTVAAALIVWLFARWVRPALWVQLADKIMLNPLKVIGFGALGVVFIPFASILLMVTVIGIPLSLILLSLYGIALYSSKIILSIYLSRFLQNRFHGSNMQTFWFFLLALILLTSLEVIPIVGMIISFLTISSGIGAIGFSLMDRPLQI